MALNILSKKRGKKGNAYAAIIVIALIATLFMGFWLMMEPFAVIYDWATNNEDLDEYTTESDCPEHWVDGECRELDERALNLLATQRRAWLAVPFIAIIGLLLWFYTVVFKDDYQRIA